MHIIFKPGMRGYFVPLGAGIALAVSAFLPWVVVDDLDPALLIIIERPEARHVFGHSVPPWSGRVDA